jgi:hypothetical protein
MVTSKNWRERMSADMRLRDFRPKTQSAYLLVVRPFLDHVGREPKAVRDDVREYFLHLREKKKLAPSSINIAVYGVRFFFVHTLGRDWPVFDLLRVKNPRKLPVVLSRSEVRAVLGSVRHPVRRMALSTIYALGLRLGEGLRLETGHIDGERLIVWVRDGKGAEDRGVPLPRPLFASAAALPEGGAPQGRVGLLVRAGAGSEPVARDDAAEDPHLGAQRCGSDQSSVHPHAAPQLRDALAGERHLASHHPANTRTQVDDDDVALPARDAAWHRAASGDARPADG